MARGSIQKDLEREEEASELREKLREAAEKQEDLSQYKNTAQEKLDQARERISSGREESESKQPSQADTTQQDLQDGLLNPWQTTDDDDDLDGTVRAAIEQEQQQNPELGPERQGILKHISEVRREAIVRGLRTWYQSGGKKDVALVGSLAVLAGAGELTTTALVKQYMKARFGAEGAESVPVTKEITERVGVTKMDEYERPFAEFEYWMGKGADEKYAMSRGAQRLESLLATDIQLSKTRMAHAVLKTQARQRYKRVIGSSNPCPLCLLASTQVYYSEDLMPIHPGCECDVEPLADDEDPRDIYIPSSYLREPRKYGNSSDTTRSRSRGGSAKTAESVRYYLEKIAAQFPHDVERAAEERKAGEIPIVNLDDIIQVHQHGEIGPILTYKGQTFRGPGDLPRKPSTEIPNMTDGMAPSVSSRIAKKAPLQPFSLGRTTITVDQQGQPVNALESLRAKKPTAAELRPGTPAFEKHRVGLLTDKQIIDKVDADLASGEFGWQRPSVQEWQRYITAKHPQVLQVYGFDDPAFTEKAVQETLSGAHDMLTKYPDVPIREIVAKDLQSDNTVAVTYATQKAGRTYSIEMNSFIYSGRYSRLVDIAKQSEADGFYFPGFSERPYYNSFVHEFGHALDNRGGHVARATVNEESVAMFKRSPEYAEAYRVASKTNDTKMMEDAYLKWQQTQLAGYSMEDGLPPGVSIRSDGTIVHGGNALSNPESIAMAFEDVERRGDQASNLSKRLHQMVVDEARKPEPAHWDPRSPNAKNNPLQNEVDALKTKAAKTVEEQKIPDLFVLKNKDGSPITYEQNDDARLTAEQREATKVATKEFIARSAQIEPAITKFVVDAANGEGFKMAGLQFRLKEGPSLYRKLQSAQADEHVPLDTAVAGIKDSIRYTVMVPAAGQWQAGDRIRDELIRKGAVVRKDPVGIPFRGYRGRNMAFTYNGTWFEVQINTPPALKVKDQINHPLYEKARLPTTSPEERKRLELIMQQNWDKIPIAKGTPVIAKEKDPNVWFIAQTTGLRGPTVPIENSPKQIAAAEATIKAMEKEAAEKLAAIEKAKGFGAVEKRLPNGKTIDVVYAKNKDGSTKMSVVKDPKTKQPVLDDDGKPLLRPVIDQKATWAKLDPEVLKENLRQAIKDSAPWAVEAGKVWYPEVNRWAKYMIGQYGESFEKRWGMPLTEDLMASFIAAYSENNSWAGNLLAIRKFLDGSGSLVANVQDAEGLAKFDIDQARKDKFKNPDGSAYDFHVAKAFRAMQNPEGGVADLRQNAAASPKPADFAANIAGDYDKATADRWMARILMHMPQQDYWIADTLWQSNQTVNKVEDRYGYKILSKAIQDVASEFPDLNAAAVQAIPWVQVVGPLGSIGYIEDLQDFASISAETTRRAKEFGDVV